MSDNPTDQALATSCTETIARQVERAMLAIPHPHPHGGHPPNCARCYAQGKLVELTTELIAAATTAARQAERERCIKIAIGVIARFPWEELALASIVEEAMRAEEES